MIYFHLEVNMENQINIGDQNSQQTGGNLSNQFFLQEKLKFSRLIILLGSILLLAIGFVGGYAYKSKIEVKPSFVIKDQPIQSENSNYINPTVKPAITEQPTVSTINWKTYSDPNGKFSYQYPNDLFIKTDSTYGMIYYYPSEDSANKGGGGAFGEALFYIQVTVEAKSSYKTFREKQTQGDASISNLGEYKDSQGRIWITNGPVWGEGDSSNYDVEISYKDKYYNVGSQAYGRKLGSYLKKELIIQKGNSFDATPLIEEQTKLIQQILSTFKFAD